VEAEVVEHGRGDKIRVFKMRRRKRLRRTKGHRQDHTVIKIVGIKK
jgi:large subunit ribosomal protein L21